MKAFMTTLMVILVIALILRYFSSDITKNLQLVKKQESSDVFGLDTYGYTLIYETDVCKYFKVTNQYSYPIYACECKYGYSCSVDTN